MKNRDIKKVRKTIKKKNIYIYIYILVDIGNIYLLDTSIYLKFLHVYFQLFYV